MAYGTIQFRIFLKLTDEVNEQLKVRFKLISLGKINLINGKLHISIYNIFSLIMLFDYVARFKNKSNNFLKREFVYRIFHGSNLSSLYLLGLLDL